MHEYISVEDEVAIYEMEDAYDKPSHSMLTMKCHKNKLTLWSKFLD